jgi:hypothetical protein
VYEGKENDGGEVKCEDEGGEPREDYEGEGGAWFAVVIGRATECTTEITTFRDPRRNSANDDPQ